MMRQRGDGRRMARTVSPAASIRRARARAQGEEGMALLLVLMLIVLVTAAGIFATQATALEVRSAGFTRQAAQTHYVAESGVVATIDKIQQNCSAYLNVMQQAALTAATPVGLVAPPPSYHFESKDFDGRQAGNANLWTLPVANMGVTAPGSFGIGRLDPYFDTTVTVLGRSPRPMFGFGVAGGRDVSVLIATMEFSSLGLVQLRGVTDSRNNARGAEQTRVIAQVPCL